MKMFINSIIIVFFVGCVSGRDGPPAEDPRWEKCNERQDSALELMANLLNKEHQYFAIKAPPPCFGCNVSDLGTIKRTGDTKFLTVVSTTTHDMKIGFDRLIMYCDCDIPILWLGSIRVDVKIEWMEPRISLLMSINSVTNTVVIPKMTVTSPINNNTTKIDCVGTTIYVESCEVLRNLGVLNTITEAAVDVLFPVETDRVIQSDTNLLLDLNCEDM